MLDTLVIDAETADASTSKFTCRGKYDIRRASLRDDAYRTQFGSLTTDEYLTPIIASNPRHDVNIARRLSRNSTLIPLQTLTHRVTDGYVNLNFSLKIINFARKLNSIKK